MKTFWCLYREDPFRVLFEDGLFEEPRRDESREPRVYDTEADARFIIKHLTTRTFVAKRSSLRGRIKNAHLCRA